MAPVICAIDDSDGARAALAIARDLAARFQTRLVLVHAEPATVVPGVSQAVATSAPCPVVIVPPGARP